MGVFQGRWLVVVVVVVVVRRHRHRRRLRRLQVLQRMGDLGSSE